MFVAIIVSFLFCIINVALLIYAYRDLKKLKLKIAQEIENCNQKSLNNDELVVYKGGKRIKACLQDGHIKYK